MHPEYKVEIKIIAALPNFLLAPAHAGTIFSYISDQLIQYNNLINDHAHNTYQYDCLP